MIRQLAMIFGARRRDVLDSCRSGSRSLRSVSTLSVRFLRLFAWFPTPRVFSLSAFLTCFDAGSAKEKSDDVNTVPQ
jgi:hypothetical protein